MKDIGIDIIEVIRFREKPFSKNKEFYDRVFSTNEQKYCNRLYDPYPSFAGRFAAKEALLKSIDRAIYPLSRIEIINDETGKPVISVDSRRMNYLISISHTDRYAMAIVLCETTKI